MLVNMKEILSHAEKTIMPSPVSIHRLRTTSAVIGAAEELNAPVIIDHAQVHDPVIPIEVIGPQMVALQKPLRFLSACIWIMVQTIPLS